MEGRPSASTKPRPRGPKKKREYKHPCPYCNRMFTCPHNVHQHVNEKHRIHRDNQCPECGAAFARPWSRNRHRLKLHGIDVRPGRGKASRKRKATDSAQVCYVDNSLRTYMASDTTLQSPMDVGNAAPFPDQIGQDQFTSFDEYQEFPIQGGTGRSNLAAYANGPWNPILDYPEDHIRPLEMFDVYDNQGQIQYSDFGQLETSVFDQRYITDFENFT